MKSNLSITLFFLTICVLGCSLSGEPSPESQFNRMSWNEKIRKFSSCQEVNSFIQANRSHLPGPDESLAVLLPASQHYSNQVESIIEGDILQSNEDYFFFARSGSIEVVEKKSLSLVRSIPIPKLISQKIILSESQLLYLGQNYAKILVKAFELKDFHQTIDKTLDGTLLDFRRINDQLIVLGQKQISTFSKSEDCTQIYYPNLNDFSGSLSLVYILDLKNQKPAQSIGLAGNTHHFYMSSDEIILFTDSPFSQGLSQGSKELYLPSHFRVIQWRNGAPELSGVVTYSGFLKDRWSVGQSNGSLFLAATMDDKHGLRSNNIQAFQKLNKTYTAHGESEMFGLGEDIRAVSYEGSRAFVVTFKKTDPLYVIDLADSDHLKILAEVKAPGFSTQLRPLNEDIWSGLGFQATPEGEFAWARGLQFSLFNFQDLAHPFEAARLEWGDRGSSSEATKESKALFITKDKDRVMFPIVVLRLPNSFTGHEHEFSGALILDIHKDQVTEVGRVTHREWREKYCGKNYLSPSAWWGNLANSSDIQRIFQSEKTIYTFSRFGVMQFDSRTFLEQARIEYDNSDTFCEAQNAPPMEFRRIPVDTNPGMQSTAGKAPSPSL